MILVPKYKTTDKSAGDRLHFHSPAIGLPASPPILAVKKEKICIQYHDDTDNLTMSTYLSALRKK